MSSGPQFFDIIILFVIAVLLISRLRSVLGTRPEDEDASKNKKDNILDIKISDIEENNIIDLKPIDKKETPSNPLISSIAEKDKNFDEKEFLEGAKIAFDMIIKAYADGDVKTLEMLLGDDVLKSFINSIENREKNNETMECQLIGFEKVQIMSSDVIGTEAKITVKFESEQINIIKNSAGEVITGDPNYVENITDIWTFNRDINSKSPNWKLTATRSV
ncbi:MAG: Tim44/TimA family putative adaptor protein [Alphaproteobacteria bacterium]